jgi:hypothetical protein
LVAVMCGSGRFCREAEGRALGREADRCGG